MLKLPYKLLKQVFNSGGNSFAWPNTHGITCFWNHTLGNALDQMDYGFDSKLLKAETIWDAFKSRVKRAYYLIILQHGLQLRKMLFMLMGQVFIQI